MPALFPNNVRLYTDKEDLVDTVLAEHVNLLQDEVTAIQNSVGTGSLTSTWSGTYAKPATHTSITSRLSNIEAGLIFLENRSRTTTTSTSSPTSGEGQSGDIWLKTV
ncbi:MAG: hypothetical protein WAO78_05800 [Roseovarius sp.]